MIVKKYNESLGVLETTFTDIISVDEIIEYIISLGEDESLPQELKIFTDASKAKFEEGVTPADMEKIVKANYFSLSKRYFIYDAFIVSGAIEMALGQLYQEFSKSKNYKFNIFSSKKAALEWLSAF